MYIARKFYDAFVMLTRYCIRFCLVYMVREIYGGFIMPKFFHLPVCLLYIKKYAPPLVFFKRKFFYYMRDTIGYAEKIYKLLLLGISSV